MNPCDPFGSESFFFQFKSRYDVAKVIDQPYNIISISASATSTKSSEDIESIISQKNTKIAKSIYQEVLKLRGLDLPLPNLEFVHKKRGFIVVRFASPTI